LTARRVNSATALRRELRLRPIPIAVVIALPILTSDSLASLLANCPLLPSATRRGRHS